MSLTKGKREEIKRYMMRHIQDDDQETIKKTMDAYGISRTTVNNYLSKMLSDGVIEKSKERASKYELLCKSASFSYNTAESIAEDQVFNADIAPLLKAIPLSNNVYEIWRYSFTEMMNNAIEHAEADIIEVFVLQNAFATTVMITDDGVGIFKKIRDYLAETENNKELSLDDAVAMLFSGKFTTDSENHTGEGIFFASRAANHFFIYSDGKIFSHDAFTGCLFDSRMKIFEKGTAVIIRVENESSRDLTEVMNMFSDVERGFFRTQLPIAHIFQNAGPISRSEARRLAAMISRFQDVVLDFSGVKTIGQAFTHELFVVFRRDNPDIQFTCENMEEPVKNMIDRVLNTK